MPRAKQPMCACGREGPLVKNPDWSSRRLWCKTCIEYHAAVRAENPLKNVWKHGCGICGGYFMCTGCSTGKGCVPVTGSQGMVECALCRTRCKCNGCSQQPVPWQS